MHWEKSSPSTLARSRPYQGVRVRDPVKELLRKKRSLEPHTSKKAPPADVIAQNHQSSYAQAIFSSNVTGSSPAECVAADGGVQYTAWKAPTATASTGLQSAMTPWCSSEYSQQDASAQSLPYPTTPTLTADVYMQALCPSYTMLTYTHTPLLTNFGTIPVAPAPASLPQMDLQDSGLTYVPWAQPLTTISTMPSTGVQFGAGSATLPGSPLVHMPLSMSLTTMIPQLEAQVVDPQSQILELPQPPERQLDPERQDHSLDEDQRVESESSNLLFKLLGDKKGDGEEDDKDPYSSSLFTV
ncbi:POU domain class 2-associating factor 1 [Betta splendens]|uniref:POU domain class 2-associating factor 1 n=1 Tax=Betta splendens TaxID=158456 RepID=A0A6P7P5L2_BETSP|nr:POU domain class 2-associating factor 1 [Betta splendens]